MGISVLLSAGSAAQSVLAGVLTADMMNGVFNELVAVLPVAMPVMVSCTAVRKGISFVSGILRSA